jgi:threonine/homoserine/homoserine lactone efflux protein
MISIEFLLTSLIIVLIPGTGVIFTISIALFKSRWEGVIAAFACTLGIIPHLIISMLSLRTIFTLESNFFDFIKYLGICYLFYLSYSLFKDKGILKIEDKNISSNSFDIILKGVMINLLNPKLTIFFLSFLPQFIPLNSSNLLIDISILSLVFMIMTFVVFIFYGLFSNVLIEKLFKKENSLKKIQKIFAIVFAFFAFNLMLI